VWDNGTYTKPFARARDARGDLAAVGDEQRADDWSGLWSLGRAGCAKRVRCDTPAAAYPSCRELPRSDPPLYRPRRRSKTSRDLTRAKFFRHFVASVAYEESAA
jgi:hypothetical protein